MVSRAINRTLSLLLALTGAISTTSINAQEAYPDRVVKLVVATTPGGITDIISRLVSQHLSESLKHQVIVENKPGANGIVGMQSVARSAPDGYTLTMAMPASQVMNPLLKADIPYKVTDFTPITLLARFPLVVAVSADLPVKTMKEFVEYAKGKQINYSSPGIGSTPHLAGARFQQLTRVEMEHVPYIGSSAATLEVIAGRVAVSFPAIADALPHIKSGKLRAIAVMGPIRSSVIPDVPTLAEAGYPNLEFGVWYGIMAPANIAPDKVEKLNREITKVAEIPSVSSRILELGGDATPLGPEKFNAYWQNELKIYGDIIKSTGVVLQ